jgi:hypothetical protein
MLWQIKECHVIDSGDITIIRGSCTICHDNIRVEITTVAFEKWLKGIPIEYLYQNLGDKKLAFLNNGCCCTAKKQELVDPCRPQE